MPLASRLFAAFLLTATAGCARHSEPAPMPAPVAAPAPVSAPVTPADTTRRALIREYRGAYTSGFELSWFEPCGAPASDRMWWVTLTDQALAQRDSILKTITAAPTKGLLVRWKGTAGPRMPAGQMGRGTRYLLVTEILEIRPLPAAGACAGRDA